MNVAYVGILFLGGFVGFLLSLTVKLSAPPTVRSIVQVIGAALGGAPMLFMQDAGSAIWAYPVGLVLGLIWARRAVTAKARRHGRGAKPSGWGDLLLPAVVSVAVVAAFAFLPDSQSTGASGHVIKREDLPCPVAWIYLGRFSKNRGNYELPPSFRYAASVGGQPPAVPRIGDVIVTTRDLTLLVSNYAAAASEKKCHGMLTPPWTYRPETADSFTAGHLPKRSQVLITQITLMPTPDADPYYVWALIKAPD